MQANFRPQYATMTLPNLSPDISNENISQDLLIQAAASLQRQPDIPSLLSALAAFFPPLSPCHSIEMHLPGHGIWRYDRQNGQSHFGDYADITPGNGHVVSLTAVIQGKLYFIHDHGSRFTAWEHHFLDAISQLADGVLTQLLRQQALRHQRDHFRILVDVTNSVLSHLEMDALVAEVAKEIHRFFGIHYISMALRNRGKQPDFDVYASYYAPGEAARHEQKKLPLKGSAVEQTLNDNQPMLLNLSGDTGAPEFLCGELKDKSLSAVCLLPLAFNHKPIGVLILAHERDAPFQGDNLPLLRQIAARIGIAVDNADAYGQITRLKDSLKHENIWLNAQIQNNGNLSDILCQSEAMRTVLEQVEMVAASDSTVLILGETGTGKELIARAIHKLSPRGKGPMIKMNCAAVPSGLLESDLFGHDKGAFTGATTAHAGRFEMAEGGSLFLDEIGDMPLELQPKLLRVLQEREIERLGSNTVIPVDVRLIAATNRDLKQMAADREFRSDLYYRLNVFPILIPPLRERPEDIPLLAKFFTQKIARRMNRTIDSIPSAALRQLSQYPWPGNVRELENVIERAVILTRGSTLNIQLHELQSAAPVAEPEIVAEKKSHELPPPETDDEERQRIIQALRETNGIVAGPRGAAVKLGLKRTTLLSRMQRLGISVREL
ncbi:sigma 54-interacting transcriptional regulator [Enterobacillus tribolii]|uniref:Hydrogenase-4 transcriptional activator n=1 Tax=Enterobacillus tribolii TaxID=1487935 RepID=A0A370Q8D5_9GAMM|nr:sigma 54-interacting transcriptional regulator [Enterobacillus tribolii]MBW7984635.1 GAF domain-containing protein [Enterobacillus tribolii]RDK84626.1 hydrogenase-4 transcriptional activator [Enterobacillus tribolii]